MKALLAFLLLIGMASATPFWNPKFIDTPGNVGSFSSMDIDGRNIFIAYSDTSLGYPSYVLKLTKSSDGGVTWATSMITTQDSPGDYVSLEAEQNAVYVSYYATQRGDLRFAKSVDGSAWSFTTVDNYPEDAISKAVGQYNSLEAIGSTVFISYYDSVSGAIKLAKSSDGGASWTVRQVDYGKFSALKAVDQNTIYIAYAAGTKSDTLKVAKSADGGVTWAINQVDRESYIPTGQWGFDNVAIDADGSAVAISYYNRPYGRLRVAKSATGGSGGWSISTADVSADSGMFSSIDVIGQTTFVSYYSNFYKDLRITRNDGGSSWSIYNIDTNGDAGKYTSIKAVNSSYVLTSYYDSTNGDLKIAEFVEISGTVITTSTTTTASTTTLYTTTTLPATTTTLTPTTTVPSTTTTIQAATTTTSSPTTTVKTTTTLSPTTTVSTTSSTTTTLPKQTTTTNPTSSTATVSTITTTTLTSTSTTFIHPTTTLDDGENVTTTTLAGESTTTTRLGDGERDTTTTESTTTTTLKKVVMPVEDIVPVDVPADLPEVPVPEHVGDKFDNHTDREKLTEEAKNKTGEEPEKAIKETTTTVIGDSERRDRIENDVGSRGRIGELKTDEEAVLDIKREEIDVRKVSVQVDEDVEDMEVTVKRLARKPAEIEKPDAPVYSYIEIDSTQKDKIKKADIEFRVDESWINAQGKTDEDVRLNHFKDGKWEELKTQKTGKDGSNVKYTAETEGFSVFVISIAIPVSGAVPSIDQTPSIQTAPSGSIVIYLFIGALLASTLAILAFIVVKTGILTKKHQLT